MSEKNKRNLITYDDLKKIQNIFNKKSIPKTMRTYQQELFHIDNEIKICMKRIDALKLKHIVVTEIKAKFNEPAPIKAKMWWEFWKK